MKHTKGAIRAAEAIIGGDKFNTHYIAAIIDAETSAGEMLEACKFALEKLDGPIGDFLTRDQMSKTYAYDAILKLQAAIAKATR